MEKGISLHIGLNYVDPNHYAGWDGELNACEYDANDMLNIAKQCKFKPTILLREQATRDAVTSFISNTASKLKENDIFFISYSGHGGQLPDLNSDEDDAEDETWCLFDGELIDDELGLLWSSFEKGVRILVISDSCHSGSVIKMAQFSGKKQAYLKAKFMPDQIAGRTYFTNKSFYDNIINSAKDSDINEIQARVKLISGCQDNQYSYDGTFNGEFTGALKKVWNGGKFSSNYSSFHKQILNLLPPRQSPNYYNIGKLNQSFDNQKPFTI